MFLTYSHISIHVFSNNLRYHLTPIHVHCYVIIQWSVTLGSIVALFKRDIGTACTCSIDAKVYYPDWLIGVNTCKYTPK